MKIGGFGRKSRIGFPTIVPTAKCFLENLQVRLGWVGQLLFLFEETNAVTISFFI
jgi:hypothetical protein